MADRFGVKERALRHKTGYQTVAKKFKNLHSKGSYALLKKEKLIKNFGRKKKKKGRVESGNRRPVADDCTVWRTVSRILRAYQRAALGARSAPKAARNIHIIRVGIFIFPK